MGCAETRDIISSPTTMAQHGSEKLQESANTSVYKLYMIYLSNLDDHSERPAISPFPHWANWPKTIACEAVSHLNKLKVLSDDKLLTEFSGKMLANIGKDRALDQHLFYFLYKNATSEHLQFINSLLEKGIFSKIAPFLMDSDSNFRTLTIKLCNKLLKYSQVSISLFYESKVINYLIAQLILKSTNKKTTTATLNTLKILLKSPTHGKLFANILGEKKSLLVKPLRSIKDQKLLEKIYIVYGLVNKCI